MYAKKEMKRTKLLLVMICVFTLAISACHKKAIPEVNSTAEAPPKPVTLEKAKLTSKKKEPTPKVITVNDAAAQKTVDGRYFYDLNGKRYWKNFKDGKYYLFNKAMYNNPEFKP